MTSNRWLVGDGLLALEEWLEDLAPEYQGEVEESEVEEGGNLEGLEAELEEARVESGEHWEKGVILNLGICIGKWMNI